MLNAQFYNYETPKNVCSSDLWDITTGRRVEEVISDKLETSTSACVSPLIVQILYSVDQLSANHVGSKCKFNSGGREMYIKYIILHLQQDPLPPLAQESNEVKN